MKQTATLVLLACLAVTGWVDAGQGMGPGPGVKGYAAGGTGPTIQGAGVGIFADDNASPRAVTLSTTGTNVFIVCGLTSRDEIITGTAISGSTLGAFTKVASATAFGVETAEVWVKMAAAAVTTEVITANWTTAGTASVFLSCSKWTNATDLTTKVANTDYRTATANGSTASPTVSVALIGAANSRIFAAGIDFDGTTFTADANSTTLVSDATGGEQWSEYSTTLYSGGSHSIGGTGTGIDGWLILAVELLP